MLNSNFKILVLFVEPMRYGLDRIREVYSNTPFTFKFAYCEKKITCQENLNLPEGSVVCVGNKSEKKKQIRSIIKEFNPDFSIINGYVGVVQTEAIKYCQKHKIPYAIESDTPLNIPGNPLKAMAKKIYLKSILANKYCYGFPGGSLQKENLVYYGIPEEKNFIMPMSVSSIRLLKENSSIAEKDILKNELGIKDKFTFLFVGRLEEVKNVELLITAFGQLKKANPNISLLIVGDGSLRQSLERQVEENDIRDVFFKGYVVFPEIVKYYKASDVFVLPSTYEPWGLVVNEAMTLGLPVIVSSDVGCRKDLVEDGINGFIFESNNMVDLQRKMELIYKSGLDIYSDNAYKRIKKWNYNYYLDCFEGAINSVKSNRL